MQVCHFWKEKRKKGELGKKSFRMYHISEKNSTELMEGPKAKAGHRRVPHKHKWPGFSSLALLSYWLWRTWERMALAMNPTCRFNGIATEDCQLAMFHTEDFLYGSSKLLSIHRSTSPSYFLWTLPSERTLFLKMFSYWFRWCYTPLIHWFSLATS